MAFIRTKAQGGRRYAYLVESVWRPDLGSPRQRVILYLGPEDEVRPEDVPEEHRGDMAVARWLEARAAPKAGLDEAKAQLRLRSALLAADRRAAEEVAREASGRLGLVGFLDRVARPMLVQLGEDWHAGRVTVADEHIATRGVSDIVRRLRDEAKAASARRRGDRARVLLANPEGEEHSLALELLECSLLAAGHHVVVCPGGAPRRDLARRARETGADLVLLSATLAASAPEALRAAHDVLAAHPAALVALGGQAWDGAGASAPEGADARIRVLPHARLEAVDALVAEALARRAPAGEAR